ncbi:hypothetical protein RJ639_007543 [Escallonia herrerae]|uniref:Uncharacterized protein n=1 Tax=Escallonia herrerae TaxID=1293975 RepID=A0AA88VV13_9ASTE|nr:hypothetical protein RJ639_007543 [Escallonia herrerae]
MGGAQAMKRIPRIKFPQRSTPQHQTISVAGDAPQTFFSGSASSNMTLGGKASLQPKRTSLSQEEIEAILCYQLSLSLRNGKPASITASMIDQVHSLNDFPHFIPGTRASRFLYLICTCWIVGIELREMWFYTSGNADYSNVTCLGFLLP